MKNQDSKNNNFLINGTRKILGILFIIAGIIGLFVPILQGIALIVVGGALLQNKYLLKKLKDLKVYFKKKTKK